MTHPDEPTPPVGPGGQQPPPVGPWGQQPPPPAGPWAAQPPAPGSWGPPPPVPSGPWGPPPGATGTPWGQLAAGPGGPGPAGGSHDRGATPPPPAQWPGQPGPYGPPPPGAYSEAPTGMSTTRIVLITLGAVLAFVGVAVVLGLVVLRQDDTAVAAPVAATPSSPSPSPSPSSSAPSSGPGVTLGPDDLVAVLPVDLTGCAAGETAGDGDLAAATCGPAITQPGPAEADFHLYPDVDTLDDVLLGDADDLGLAELPEDVDCTAEMGYGEWTYASGETGGLLACGLTGDGRAVIAWTDDEFLVEGALLAPGTTQEDVGVLFDWWTEHSEYTS
jgi:hypothetical protein